MADGLAKFTLIPSSIEPITLYKINSTCFRIKALWWWWRPFILTIAVLSYHEIRPPKNSFTVWRIDIVLFLLVFIAFEVYILQDSSILNVLLERIVTWLLIILREDWAFWLLHIVKIIIFKFRQSFIHNLQLRTFSFLLP